MGQLIFEIQQEDTNARTSQSGAKREGEVGLNTPGRGRSHSDTGEEG